MSAWQWQSFSTQLYLFCASDFAAVRALQDGSGLLPGGSDDQIHQVVACLASKMGTTLIDW